MNYFSTKKFSKGEMSFELFSELITVPLNKSSKTLNIITSPWLLVK